jgi:hypothetical protein
MRFRVVLIATAVVAGALTITTTASATSVGEGVSTGSPEPAFSWCEIAYTAPYMNGRFMKAHAYYTCNGPDPRNGQPTLVRVQRWVGGSVGWEPWDTTNGIGTAVYPCAGSTRTWYRIRGTQYESQLPCG